MDLVPTSSNAKTLLPFGLTLQQKVLARKASYECKNIFHQASSYWLQGSNQACIPHQNKDPIEHSLLLPR